MAVVLAAALGGCVPANRPATCGDDALTIALTVSVDGMEPGNPGACQGQRVTLAITPTIDGTFHIHGLDDAVPATTIHDGEPLELAFTADQTGQFPVELHPADDPEGVEIGILTIYDR